MQRTRLNGRRIILELIPIVLLAVLIVVDQVVKIHCKSLHENAGWSETVVIKNFFYFRYTFNTGAAWSFLSDVPWGQTFFKVLTVIALICFIAVYIFFVMKRNYKVLRYAMILVIAGTIGNFIDRLAYNGVVDFLSFVFGSYNFPIFNLADTFMVVGVVMVIVHLLFLDKNALFTKSNKRKEKPNENAIDSTTQNAENNGQENIESPEKSETNEKAEVKEKADGEDKNEDDNA